MHLKDDQLRAYIDRELPEATIQQIDRHLAGCPRCRQQFEHVRRTAEQVRARIDSLRPTQGELPRPARMAYARLSSDHPTINSQKVRVNSMLRKKSFWSTLAVIAALVLVFTMTPARAWASTFLNLFRVQQVQVITFDPAALGDLENQLDANEAVFKQVFEENMEVSGREEPQPVDSAAEAAQLAGFTPRLPSTMAGAGLAVQPEMTATLTIDQPKLQELANLAGVDLVLPEALDGQAVRVSKPAAVIVAESCDDSGADQPDRDCLAVVQMPSPSVDAPADLDLPVMGAALFQMLGYSAEEAAQLSASIDWTSTLVLPIPTNADVAYSEVSVDGVTGTLLVEDQQAMLIWVKNGMLYAVTAPEGAEQALAVAESLE